jgi:hypothetical protein
MKAADWQAHSVRGFISIAPAAGSQAGGFFRFG